jgi:PilZ domain
MSSSLELLTVESEAQSPRIPRDRIAEAAAPRADVNRRAHPRLGAPELRWIHMARLKYGPAVRLIDLSVGGALLESSVQLRPGSNLALELVGASQLVVPLRVVRCQLTSLAEQLVYRGACAFSRPMELNGLLPRSKSSSNSADAPSDHGTHAGCAFNGVFYKESDPMDGGGSHPQDGGGLTSSLDSAETRTSSTGAMTKGWTMVILRYLHGEIIRGFCNDFSSTRSQFHLWPSVDALRSERIIVSLSRLKAVFFVRDLLGNPAYVDRQEFEGAGHGRKMEITFLDGEVIVGSTLGYRTDGPGFFLHPADPRSNNLRIFIVTGSVRHTRFL